MKAKVHYYVTDSHVTKEQAEMISQARSEADYDALVNIGLATRHIEGADMIFTKHVMGLTRWQKVRLLFRLLVE